MLDLFDLIQNIEKRPAMYLGQADQIGRASCRERVLMPV